MLEMFLFGSAVTIIVFFIVLYVEERFLKDQKFNEVKNWHKFQTAMNKKGKN